MSLTLNNLFTVTQPYTEETASPEEQILHFYDNVLYKKNTHYRDGKIVRDFPDSPEIILVPYGGKTYDIIGYALIKHSDLYEEEHKFRNFINIEVNNLDVELSGEQLKKIIDFFIAYSQLKELINSAIEAEKLKELINSAIEAEKLEKKLKELIKVYPKDNVIYKQLIIYGPAGVGKTYGIKKLVSNNENDGLNISEENFEKQTIHTVFHPEYSYYDFFGKVMPTKDKNNSISYDFLPGPFAQALSKAYKNIIDKPKSPDKVVLVIDELNRGNASSIFGGLFNLLDRNKKGISEYPLNIYGMEAIWLRNQIGEENLCILELYSQKINFKMYDQENNSLKIYIPDNLSIICTMNTSDQTIFSLDKAFQRRFNKHFITAKYSIENMGDDIEIEDTKLIWKNFLIKLNEFIVENADVDDVDNATIGAYFVKPKKNIDGREVILEEDIKYTIMYYLWYDLFNGYRRETLKEKLDGDFIVVKSFEQFVSNYQNFINFFIPPKETTN